MFGVDQATIAQTINSVIQEMWVSLQSKLVIPDLNTRIKKGRRLGKYFISVIVDGSEQQILESLSKRKKSVTFSGKKKFHTFTKLIGILPNGRIVFISLSLPGNILQIN